MALNLISKNKKNNVNHHTPIVLCLSVIIKLLLKLHLCAGKIVRHANLKPFL